MAQSQGWVKRYIKAFCKGFFVAVPVAVTFLDRVACVARVEGASMQPSLNPGGSQSSDVVLLNHWKVRNFEVHRGDIVSLVCLPFANPNLKLEIKEAWMVQFTEVSLWDVEQKGAGNGFRGQQRLTSMPHVMG
ncbi:mitochondrial inner membrane protease subunit 2 isoform X5 [Symphalangus syndactylus]|uniref:mitochondrial inner membrane protease subunit 2 isoform X5 n=1 Tax=Symphalangus syndactylus TaxID=9590 RepID=UPI003007AA4C